MQNAGMIGSQIGGELRARRRLSPPYNKLVLGKELPRVLPEADEVMVRKMLALVFCIGLLIAALALAAMAAVWIVSGVRALPTGEAMTAAWIGFAGSVIGALITVVVALLALWPAYRQMGEMQRASSVQSGQILRVRLRALQTDWNILLKNTFENRMPELLRIEPDDDLAHWAGRHPDNVAELRDIILPRIEEIHSELIMASMGIDLPDLDRGDYIMVLQDYAAMLRTVLDGLPRGKTDASGQPLTAEQWRAHVVATKNFAERRLPQAHLAFNNIYNAANQIIRWQIIQADRSAIGPENTRLFDATQKQSAALSKRPAGE